MYVHSTEHRAVRLLSRRDEYGLQIFGNWNQRWSTELRGDRPGRSQRTRTVAVSRNLKESLYDKRQNIYKKFRNEYKDNFISVGPLTVRICTLNDATLVRLDSSSVRIMVTETTLRRMFDFDGCIDVTFERLVRLVDTVDAKYTRFSNITFEDAIRVSDFFNGRQLIDCELLALIFNTYEKKISVITCE